MSLIKKEKILGKEYIMLGDNSTDIILNGKGNVKVRFGRSFLDLVKNGKLHGSTSTDHIVQVVSKDAIGSTNGFYFVENEGLYYKIGDAIFQLVSKDSETGSDTIGYISYNILQQLKKEELDIAYKNLKATILDTTSYDGLADEYVYFSKAEASHFYLKNMEFKELYLNLDRGGNVLGPVSIANTLNIVSNKGVVISDKSNKAIISPEKFTIPAIYSIYNDSGGININNNNVGINCEPTEFNLDLEGTSRFRGPITINNSITTPNFISGLSGYGARLNNINNNWTLELDNIIIRKAISLPPGFDFNGNAAHYNYILTGSNNNYLIGKVCKLTYIDVLDIVEEPTETATSRTIQVLGLYDITAPFKLKWEINNVEPIINTVEGEDIINNTLLKTTSKGIFNVTSIGWEDKDGYLYANLTGTFSDNIIDGIETFPSIGDNLVVETESYIYYNYRNVSNTKNIQFIKGNNSTFIGDLENNISYFSNEDISTKNGISTSYLNSKVIDCESLNIRNDIYYKQKNNLIISSDTNLTTHLISNISKKLKLLTDNNDILHVKANAEYIIYDASNLASAPEITNLSNRITEAIKDLNDKISINTGNITINADEIIKINKRLDTIITDAITVDQIRTIAKDVIIKNIYLTSPSVDEHTLHIVSNKEGETYKLKVGRVQGATEDKQLLHHTFLEPFTKLVYAVSLTGDKPDYSTSYTDVVNKVSVTGFDYFLDHCGGYYMAFGI